MERNHYADVAVVITAAGNSSRMRSGQKKEFLKLGNRSVLIHTLHCFLETGTFARFVITINEDGYRKTQALIDRYLEENHSFGRPPVITIVPGGASRQESVFYGLLSLEKRPPHYVLIHDGARPWVSPDTIRRVIAGTREHDACIPVRPVVDALKTTDAAGRIDGHPPRHRYVHAQTPQGFNFARIVAAHRKAAARDTVNMQAHSGRDAEKAVIRESRSVRTERGDTGTTENELRPSPIEFPSYVDDSHLFCEYEGPVYTVLGNAENTKITYPADLQQIHQIHGETSE